MKLKFGKVEKNGTIACLQRFFPFPALFYLIFIPGLDVSVLKLRIPVCQDKHPERTEFHFLRKLHEILER